MVIASKTSPDRKRILELALKGNTVRQIAERYRMSYDSVRHAIERAEKSGDVPLGTLQRCGVVSRQPGSRSA